MMFHFAINAGRKEKKIKTTRRNHKYKTAAADDGNAYGCIYYDFGACIFSVSMKGGQVMWKQIKEFVNDERGITSVEIILILVILIGLVLIFKEEMTELVNNIFKTITSQSGKVLK